MVKQDDFDILCAAVQQLKETVEQQQKQIKVLSDINRNLSQRLNRLDKLNRESNQALW